ncbi:hypothetical protein AAMO2058_000724500 [Amorphochlora amoebiformis]
MSAQACVLASKGGEYLFRVIEFALDWKDRGALPVVCKGWRAWAASNNPHSKYWTTMGECLEREVWLSVSTLGFRRTKSPREAFFAVFFRRHFADREKKESSFTMRVAVRFRPDRKDRKGEQKMRRVVIPLHQRIQMVKASTSNLKDRNEAIKNFMLSSRGSREKERSSIKQPNRRNTHSAPPRNRDREVKSDRKSRRPDLKGEFESGKEGGSIGEEGEGIVSIDEKTSKVVMLAKGVGLRGFDFDTVLDDKSSQSGVYENSASELVHEFMNGYNCCIFVYGQTGSGKTHTMFGPEDHKSPGVVWQACNQIMRKVEQRRRFKCQSTVGVSYVEVFGDQVTDLLSEIGVVSDNKVAAREFVLKGRVEQEVKSIQSLRDFLLQGEARKRRAATAMNERSSRAHTLLIIRLRQVDETTGAAVESRLILADLGGAEQVNLSKVEGERLKEAVHINLGLLALKKCIDALKRKEKFVPFGDSMLTKLLSSALGGNSKTGVIVCASKEPVNSAMTMQSLRFGEKCRSIQSTASQARAIALSVLEELNKQIAECEAVIKKKERWENRRVEREDIDGTTEVLFKSYLVGAEEERKLLEDLVIRRARFLGSFS